MPYVLKSATGSIEAVSIVKPDDGAWLFMDESNVEYTNFLEAQLTSKSLFRESDIELARVLEDLIALLIDRDIIHFTDFPEAAQKRLIERKSLRMTRKHLNLVDDNELI